MASLGQTKQNPLLPTKKIQPAMPAIDKKRALMEYHDIKRPTLPGVVKAPVQTNPSVQPPAQKPVFDERAEVIRKAQAGIPLTGATAEKQALYDQYAKKPATPTNPTTPATSNPATPQQPFNVQDYIKQYQEQVNGIYDKQRQAEIERFKAQRDEIVGKLDQQKSELSPMYADKRNQADVVNAQNVNKLRELMASSGLSGSGENITSQVALGSARQGALNQLNTQEQQEINEINRAISQAESPAEMNYLIAQLESQRGQALMDAMIRGDEVGYARNRDSLMDRRYEDETKYGRSVDKRNFDYQKYLDDYNIRKDRRDWDYQKDQDEYGKRVDRRNWDYQKSLDEYGMRKDRRDWDYQKEQDKYDRSVDTRNFDYQKYLDDYNQRADRRNFDYQKDRDAVGDERYDKEFNRDEKRYAEEKAWREYQFKNMSASEKAQLAWAKEQYGEDAAWRMFELNYNGELQKSMSQSEIDYYSGLGLGDFLG